MGASLRKVSVTALKDEAPYIVEWLAYQKLIGFDEVVIATNDCTDGSAEIVDRLAAGGYCHAIHFAASDHDLAPQLAAYQLITEAQPLSDPCLLLVSDVDEFLQINVGDGTLDALFEAARPFDLMLIRWRLFGSSGHHEFEDRLVTQRYLSASPRRYGKKSFRVGSDGYATEEEIAAQGPAPESQVFDRDQSLRWSRTYKCLFKYRPGDKLSVHLPRTSRGYLRRIDSGGRPDPDERYSFLRFYGANTFEGSYDLCQMNHYCNRSVEEYLMKLLRGDGIHATDPRGIEHWKIGECNEVEETGMRRWAKPLEKASAEIIAQCRLRPLLDKAIETRRKRFEAKLEASPDFAALARLLVDLAGTSFPRSVHTP